MSEEKQRLRRQLFALERTFDRGIYKHQQAIARLMGLKKAERIKARDAGVITEAEMDDA